MSDNLSKVRLTVLMSDRIVMMTYHDTTTLGTAPGHTELSCHGREREADFPPEAEVVSAGHGTFEVFHLRRWE